LEWDGLNLQNPLREKLLLNHDLTPEELEERAQASVEKARARKKADRERSPDRMKAIDRASYQKHGWKRREKRRLAMLDPQAAEGIRAARRESARKYAEKRKEKRRLEKLDEEAEESRRERARAQQKAARERSPDRVREARRAAYQRSAAKREAKEAQDEKWRLAKAQGGICCDACKVVFKTKSSLSRHNRNKHGN
jgi:hypothetical protein